jgi:predicted dienelactone hydrolase
MRIFEGVLLFVNVLNLFLSFKQQPIHVRVGLLGANLAVLLLHGILEGFRYQMSPAYVIILFFVIYQVVALAQSYNRLRTVKIPKFIRLGAICLALMALLVTALLTSALPVFTLPKPTGNYAVGIHYFHWTDQARDEPFVPEAHRKRELMVKVHYPAKPDDEKPFAPYFRGSSPLLKLFASANGLPAFLFDHLTFVKSHAKEGLSLADDVPRYPVVLFSHGGGTSMEVHTAQAEDLASHGYIVVAIDHTYASAATQFPDHLVSARDATANFAPTGEPVAIIVQIMVDDARFVLDTLAALDAGQVETFFTGRLDLEKVGAVGHSLGGAVAYDLALHDQRVKAAINLDGRVFTVPSGELGNIPPFLMLANDDFYVQMIQNRQGLLDEFDTMTEELKAQTIYTFGSEEAYRAAYAKAQQEIVALRNLLLASGNLYTIEGSSHMKFTDIGLFFGIQQLREQIGIGGKTDPARCLVITQALTRAFFDQHLQGSTDLLFPSLAQQYAELIKVKLD